MLISEGIYLSNQVGREVTAAEVRGNVTCPVADHSPSSRS